MRTAYHCFQHPELGVLSVREMAFHLEARPGCRTRIISIFLWKEERQVAEAAKFAEASSTSGLAGLAPAGCGASEASR